MQNEWKLSEELSILESWCFRPIMRNSVLEECKKICGHPGGNLFQSSLEVGDTWVKVARMEREKRLSIICVKVVVKTKWEMRVLSGVVYMKKSSGPRTEPWGTPQEEICSQEKSLSHLTRKERSNHKQSNHSNHLKPFYNSIKCSQNR